MFLLIENEEYFLLKKLLIVFKIMFTKRGEVKASLISSKELSETELENISKNYLLQQAQL